MSISIGAGDGVIGNEKNLFLLFITKDQSPVCVIERKRPLHLVVISEDTPFIFGLDCRWRRWRGRRICGCLTAVLSKRTRSLRQGSEGNCGQKKDRHEY